MDGQDFWDGDNIDDSQNLDDLNGDEFASFNDNWGNGNDTAQSNQTTGWGNDAAGQSSDWDTQSSTLGWDEQPVQSMDTGRQQASEDYWNQNAMQNNNAFGQNTNQGNQQFADNTMGQGTDLNSGNNDYWQQQQQQENMNTKGNSMTKGNIPQFSVKAAGLIVGVILFVLFLIVMFASRIKISSKNNAAVAENQQYQTTQATTQTTQSNNGMVKLEDNVRIDYSGAVLEANGVVSSKTKYLQGDQVIYCLNISIGMGTGATNVAYYCTYSTWSSVGINDTLTVRYQQVSNNCFSVNEVIKQ